jgi:hypothetical protein
MEKLISITKQTNKQEQMMSAEIRTMLEDMTGVGEDKDYIIKTFENLEQQRKTLEDIHEGDMKIVKMLREKWNEERQENKELKEALDIWVNPNGEVVMNREGMMLYEASQEKNEELKEEVRYWKNFALFYWSGHQLGKEVNSDSDVWREALERVNENNDCDVEQLTKKCMEEYEDN